jgi:putative membrane protein
VLGALPWVRRALIPAGAARSACHRAALAQFVLRGIDRSQCGVLIYVSLAEHYIRVIPAEQAAAAVSPEQWKALVDEALGPLAAGAIETALTGLANHCADRLAGPFPPTIATEPPQRQRFHML